MNGSFCSRRRLLQMTLAGSAAALAQAPRSLRAAPAPEAPPTLPAVAPAKVSLTHGDSRADLAFQSLRMFDKQIAAAIGNRRVVIKPNNVAIDKQLASTHAQTIEGICEFLKSIGKLENAVIAESAANGATFDGFDSFKYPAVASKYGVKMMDLDAEGFQVVHVFDEKDFRPHPVRMSKLLLDSSSFVISAARMKTHDRVLATLSLKNIVFGAPIKDRGFAWGPNRKPGLKTDKPIAHGSGIRGINFNLFALAEKLHPHLAVIDGYEGMEGNGPTNGTAVDHRVCVTSLDWLAADRVAVELMGIDYANVGYLNYCAEAGLGQADLKKIEVLGEPIERHIKKYKLAKNLEQQLLWKQPVS